MSHIGLQTKDHVVYDPVAILHYGCTHLHIVATQLYEFQSITPGLDTTYAAELYILDYWVLDYVLLTDFDN